MISVVLYGRNDAHGYNLPKRAAISLNCIAEMLSHPDDEIVFVDCNTPDDLPTFPEALQDTLTARAKQVLRVVRLPPALYEQHKRGSPLPALETLCRNVAVRRSNPANRWILSTNTDMVFVPRRPGQSLSDVAGTLSDGFYELPRFEVPEALWDTLVRTDPAGVMTAFERWGTRLHLNEAILSEPHIRFDAPGDFQLVLRDQMFAVHGFNEAMTMGYHVDSNLAKRLLLLNGRTESLLDEAFAYHCTHTRRAASWHQADRTENDPHRFIDRVTSPYLPDQADTWGLPGIELEEIRLSDEYSGRFERVLETLLPGSSSPVTEDVYVGRSFNHGLFYDTAHAFPFVANHLSTLASGATVGYVGGNAELLSLMARFRSAMGHAGQMLFDRRVFGLAKHSEPPSLPSQCVPVALRRLIEQADALFFDAGMQSFGKRVTSARIASLLETADALSFKDHLHAAFAVCAKREEHRARAGEGPPRKFLFVGSQHTWLEVVASKAMGLDMTPYCSHVQQGYARAKPGRAPQSERPAGSPGIKAGSEGKATPDVVTPQPPCTGAAPHIRGAGGADGGAAPQEAAGAPVPLDARISVLHRPAAQVASERSTTPESERRLRVLLVADGLPPRTLTDVALQTQALAAELRRRGHSVRVAYPEYDTRQAEGAIVEDVHDGLPVTRINAHRDADGISEFRNERLATAFARYVAGFDLDLVHFQHLAGLSAAALQRCRELGIPTALTVHDAWLLCEQHHLVHAGGGFCERGPETVEKCADCVVARRPWSFLAGRSARLVDVLTQRAEFLRESMAWIDTLIVPSRFIQETLATHGMEHARAFVIPPGVGPYETPVWRPSEGPLRCAFFGEVAPWTGSDVLVRAFNLIEAEQARLDIYGMIRDFDYFDRTWAEVSPSHRVAFWGAHDADELPDILGQTDVAAIPYRGASYPSVVQECLNAGVPVIGPAAGACLEILRDGENGLFFRPGDHEDLARKLRFFTEDPRRVTVFRSQIVTPRTLADEVTELERVYHDTVALRSRAGRQESVAEPALGLLGPSQGAGDSALEALNAGQRHLEGGRWEEAARELNRALDLNPLLAPAHYLLGCTEIERGRLEPALRSLRQAVELAGHVADFHNALGVALHRAGDRSGAEIALRQAVELDASRGDVWANLGELHEAQGRFAEAATAYRQALALAPDDGHLRAALARAEERSEAPSPDGAAATPAACDQTADATSAQR